MKIVAIIQARMGSTRLPGKMLQDIAGKPAIERVFKRVRQSKLIQEIWLATTASPADDKLADWAEKNGVSCYRGSENDVLDRYYQAALKSKADVAIRITGDCPLLDWRVVDEVIKCYGDGSKYDYASNTDPPTYPDGLDVEIFSFKALERAWKEAELQSEREHVTPYIRKHPELFKMSNVKNDTDLSFHRWTLDTKEDLDLISRIAGECDKIEGDWGLPDIIRILSEHPDWLAINKIYQRNEGYQKSLNEDKKIK